jgi:hypothetical protein
MASALASMTSESPYPAFTPADVDTLLENARKWKECFNEPLPLGVKKAISIITCMVIRLGLCKKLHAIGNMK